MYTVRIPNDSENVFIWVWKDRKCYPNLPANIKKEVIDWCNDNAGPGNWGDANGYDFVDKNPLNILHNHHLFYFKSKEVAVMFKMVWG